jgi:tetratricopeptide (TPR) repeat protein
VSCSIVFISHSSKDKAIADAICNHLESAAIKCWIAPRDIGAGSDWTTGIVEGIAECRILVVVFTAHANGSEHVGREVAQAFSMGLAVIPFRVEAVVPRDSLAYFLATVHWLDATTPPLHKHLGPLTERVKRLLIEAGRSGTGTAESALERKIRPRRTTSSKRSLRIIAAALAGAVIAICAAVWFFAGQDRAAHQTAPAKSLAAGFVKSIAVLISFTDVTFETPLYDAIRLLEQAVRLDPKFTLAYCAESETHDFLFKINPNPERRTLADTAVQRALELQPDLSEVHLAFAQHLFYCYRDNAQARVQLAIAKRGLPNNVDAILLEAYIDRRQGNWEKAIEEFNEAIARDPRNAIAMNELASTLPAVSQFRAAEQAFDRLIELRPDQPMLKVQKALFVTFLKTGNDEAIRSAIARLPASMADDNGVLNLRLSFALVNRDWPLAKQLLAKMKGHEDEGYFAYVSESVPIGCYAILLARLQGENVGADPEFTKVREQLSEKVQEAPEAAGRLSELAVVNALLNVKETAIAEAKHAIELLPISKDALAGAGLVTNLAVVYAWADELDLAFATLEDAAKTPACISYGELKRDLYWEPLRKDPRYEKLLAELKLRDRD